jgi:hypothetical protein
MHLVLGKKTTQFSPNYMNLLLGGEKAQKGAERRRKTQKGAVLS